MPHDKKKLAFLVNVVIPILYSSAFIAELIILYVYGIEIFELIILITLVVFLFVSLFFVAEIVLQIRNKKLRHQEKNQMKILMKNLL